MSCRPRASVAGVVISDEALTVSKENLRRNHQNRTIWLAKADAPKKPSWALLARSTSSCSGPAA